MKDYMKLRVREIKEKEENEEWKETIKDSIRP
jgi:hypothetical protein